MHLNVKKGVYIYIYIYIYTYMACYISGFMCHTICSYTYYTAAYTKYIDIHEIELNL